MRKQPDVTIDFSTVEKGVDENGEPAIVYHDVVVRVGTIDARTLLRRVDYGGRKGRRALRRLLALR